ncbi:prolyl aminopeptidase [Gammaproteobacteria bacterium]|jgi:proline iminopeptidase|nr:prolyl aminopeptidase [Gammaproteobacteria bacterium]MDA9033057.1 prolyl aminopeptidase [Gammaproteobacteria bacterium]MDB2503364.1 prolyl aminopeptidase [Gammaproteobacteria bacterium]MDB2569829.1 prolyl aminopeptidase [Gammaproteobacteria bacterium]MDB4848613.1 prolyl aminopeptidase [Gammaproteobacteria bacterium]|tara:strand:- start:629 stop:1591 length:963 start_codon:yes stop_codon:yes gene_type:complete
MNQLLSLFPPLEPFNFGFMEKDNHRIYYEQCGNPDGKPAVFLHGGPGGGGSTQVRRFFDPDKYHVVIFDQRGCGRSLPHGCLENNTTWDLVEDIENLKVKLGIKQWLVFGGSWGSTLALAYSQTYPDSVSEMVLRGIFMLRKKELDWFYQYGASNIFPEAWQKFIEPIEHNERDDLMAAYHKIFLSNNEEKKLNAAIAWSRWEGSTSSLSYNPDMANSFSDPKFALAFALIENHYFVNKGFLEHENQLIESGINIIRDIPTVIVQGRYDIVCPISTAWELSQNWPEAELIVAPSSGHTAFELEITHELIKATNTFADSYE